MSLPPPLLLLLLLLLLLDDEEAVIAVEGVVAPICAALSAAAVAGARPASLLGEAGVVCQDG